ncbi:MAG TPA: sialidase family protein, partial [Blastocatellia bacterium]|nr:sialidase family protein [Blastocatellia bacterium]
MRKIVSTGLTVVLLFILITPNLFIASANGPDPDQGSVFQLPQGPANPFQYGIAPFPTQYPIKVRVGGDNGDGGQSAGRLLQDAIFNKLSSAGQRAVLEMNGMISSNSRILPNVIGAQALPIPGLDPEENVVVDDPSASRRTQSETSICVDGDNIVESYNDDSDHATSAYSFSDDGGRTFTQGSIPETSNLETLGDGVVALGLNGEIYYSTLEFLGNDSAVGVAKSTDHGHTFGLPVNASTNATNKNDFQDKEWIAVDRNATSPLKGNVYVTWTDFAANGIFIQFSRSMDGGNHFSKPVALSDPQSFGVQGSNIAVGPDGTIHVFYLQEILPAGILPEPSGIIHTRSKDGGKSWSQPTLIASLIPVTSIQGIGDVRANSFPNAAVGPDGVIHVVYGAQPALLGPDRSDVFYLRSNDGGDSFSSPVKLNDDQTDAPQLFPAIAVTAGGVVGCKWWDRRNGPQKSLTDVYMTISNDSGNTFGRNFRVSNHNFLTGPIDAGINSGYHGDYDGIAADSNTFYVSWSDEFLGTPDGWFAKVPASRDPGAPDFVVSSGKLYDAVIAGQSVDFSITSTAVGGFAGGLSLSIFPQAPGITASFDSAAIAAGQSSNIRIDTSSGAVPGPYLFTVTATGSGKTRATVFRMTVISPTSALTAPPSNLSLSPGYSFLVSKPQVDSSGVIHAVYYDNSDLGTFGYKVFYLRSSDGGRTYSKPIPISRDGDQSAAPILKLDSAGNIFVAWQSTTFQESGGAVVIASSSIQLAVSRDGGGT